MVQTILSSLTELTLLALVLVMLYSFRYAIGTAPTYIAAGLYFVFAMMVGSSRLSVTAGAANTLSLYNGLLWLPFLLLLLIVYELEGTGAAQRFYVGLVIGTGLFVLLFLFLAMQPAQDTVSTTTEFLDSIRNLAHSPLSRGEILHGILSHLFLFLLVPILYQATLNRCRGIYGLAIFLSMGIYTVLVEALGAIYIFLIAESKAYTPTAPSGWFLRLGAALIMAVLGHFFIVISTPYRKKTRKALRFLTGFVDFFFSPERMMRSLSEWSERYRVVVENSSELILLVDHDGKVINANRIAVKYLGHILDESSFRLEQVVFDSQNRPWAWQARLPDAQDIDLDVNGQTPATHKQVFRYNNLFLRVPGKKSVDLDLNVSHIQLEGKPIAVVIGRDMTNQREEERQRQSRQEKMMHSQRLESLGELAGGIAHDFNNLLQSIQMSVEGLQMKLHGAPETAPLVHNIEEGCRRATVLTSQLLGFARKGKFHAEEIDATDLLNHALQLFQPVAKGLTCKVLCEPVPLPLFVDEIQLAQVLLNMLINSRDALRDQPDPRHITLRAERVRENMPEWAFRPNRDANPEDYICIHVRDNGVGMSEAVRQRVFEPFFTTKPAGQGTGMGLPMAFGCIANHHGWIHVDSEPNKGCHITIFLPNASTAHKLGTDTAN